MSDVSYDKADRNNIITKLEILRSRKNAMAALRRAGEHESTMEVVEFLLGEETYAFEVEKLREIVPLTGLTHIPSAPHFVLGVINVRGQIVPIIDLKAFIGLESAPVRAFSKVIILHRDKLIIGLVADDVIGARKLPISELQYQVGMLCGVNAEFVQAVSTARLVLLNSERLLLDPRLTPSKPADGE